MCYGIYCDTGVKVRWRYVIPKERQTDGMKSAPLPEFDEQWSSGVWCMMILVVVLVEFFTSVIIWCSVGIRLRMHRLVRRFHLGIVFGGEVWRFYKAGSEQPTAFRIDLVVLVEFSIYFWSCCVQWLISGFANDRYCVTLRPQTCKICVCFVWHLCAFG